MLNKDKETGGLTGFSTFDSAINSLVVAAGGNTDPFIMPPSCCTQTGDLCEASRKSLLTASFNPIIHSTVRWFDLFYNNFNKFLYLL